MSKPTGVSRSVLCIVGMCFTLSLGQARADWVDVYRGYLSQNNPHQSKVFLAQGGGLCLMSALIFPLYLGGWSNYLVDSMQNRMDIYDGYRKAFHLLIELQGDQTLFLPKTLPLLEGFVRDIQELQIRDGMLPEEFFDEQSVKSQLLELSQSSFSSVDAQDSLQTQALSYCELVDQVYQLLRGPQGVGSKGCG